MWASQRMCRATLPAAIAARLHGAGAQEIGFGDTTGMANPRGVREFFTAVRASLGAEVELTAHFHTTCGQGLANVLAALEVVADVGPQGGEGEQPGGAEEEQRAQAGAL